MSCGTPVITSNAGALPEIGGDAATYVDPQEVSSIRDALAAFENGGANLAQLRERGLRHAAQFSWSRCAREI